MTTTRLHAFSVEACRKRKLGCAVAHNAQCYHFACNLLTPSYIVHIVLSS
jgi:hypothetical protein